MKITRAEADLIERVREQGADPSLVADNIKALAAGQADISRYLCHPCKKLTEKVLLFRSVLKENP